MVSFNLGKEASRLAVEGAEQAAASDIVSANATADAALAELMNKYSFSFVGDVKLITDQNSLDSLPAKHNRQEWNIMAGWDEDKVEMY